MNQKERFNILMRMAAVTVFAVGVSSFFLQHIMRVNAETCKELIDNECAELRWERAPAALGEIAEIAISPIDPDVMYAGVEVNSHSLYKSTDGGKTWRRVNGGGDHTKDVAVSPKDPNKVYFAMSDTIHSTDLSVKPTMRSLTSPARPGGETIDIFSIGRLAGSPGGLLSTLEIFDQDDNVIYAAMTWGSSGPRIMSKPVIFKTTDGGNTWREIRPDVGDINVIEIHPVNHELIYIGTSDGLYVSNDSGKTVEKLKTTRAIGGFISVELQKDNPDVLYIASGSEVFKSENAGKTWKDISGSLSDIHRVRISHSHPNVLYVATFNGVFKSDDSGRTWVNKTNNLRGKNIQIVTIHPKNPDIAFIGHSSLWSSVRSSKRYKHALWADNGIFKTVDGGNSWSRSDEGMFEYNLEEVAVSPHRPNEAWVTAPASVGGHKSIDAAHNWLLTQIHTLHYPMKIKYSMQSPDKIYATSWHPGGPFALSLDGGASWKTTNEQEIFKGINRGKNLYRVGSGQQIQPVHLHGLAVDPKDDTVVYSGSVHDRIVPGEHLLEGSHIWKSKDTGKTWQEYDEGFPHEKHTAIHDIQIDPKNSDIIYVATTEHEAEIGIGIYKSIDAGKTWKAINNGLDGHALSVGVIAIHPEHTGMLLAATHGGLFKSKDGGQSWTKTSTSHSFDVEYIKSEPHTVYASTNDGVLKSKDFGDTWYEVNYGLPEGEGQGIGVSIDGNVIYSAVKFSGVFAARIKPVAPIKPTSVNTARGFEYTFSIGGMAPDAEIKSDVRAADEPRLSEEAKPNLSRPESGIKKSGPSLLKATQEDGKESESDFSGKEKKGRTVTLEECRTYDLPKDCNKGDSPEGIADCETCHKLLPKEERFFTKIINFFKRIFSFIMGVLSETPHESAKFQKEERSNQDQSSMPKPEPIKPQPTSADLPKPVTTENPPEITKLSAPSQKLISISQNKNKLAAIQTECSKQPVVPAGTYRELLTDVHVHTMIRDDPFGFAIKLLQEMNENGADRIVIQPNHSPITVLENSLLDKAWGEIAAVCSRIIPLVYGFNPGDKDAWLYVKERLDTGNYGGVGEIEFQHGSFDIKQDPESESMLKIYDILEEKRFTLSFQASLRKDPGLEEKMFKIISARPNVNFLWFGGCPVSERFMALSNLYCSVFINNKDYLPRKEDFKRSLIGTDSGPAGFWNGGGLLPYSSFGEAIAEAREILARQQKEDADAIAYKNFDKIWPK